MGQTTARTIAFISNKGGVGKTHIAINLAIQFAKEGRRVLLVDTDLGSATADLRLGVRPTTTLLDFYEGRADIFCCLTNTEFGFQLLAGRSGEFGLANLTHEHKIRLLKAFDALVHEGNYTDVLFDLGGGISHRVLDFGLVADELVIVTTPMDIVSAYAALKACWTRYKELSQMEYFKERAVIPQKPFFMSNMAENTSSGPRINFIVNQVIELDEGKKVFLRILQVARSFFYTPDGNWYLPVRYLGAVQDAHMLVKQAERMKIPAMVMNPYHEFSHAIREISAMLLAKQVIAPSRLRIPFTDRVRSIVASWAHA